MQADRVDHCSDDAPAADQLDQREHRIGAPTELGLRGFHIAGELLPFARETDERLCLIGRRLARGEKCPDRRTDRRHRENDAPPAAQHPDEVAERDGLPRAMLDRRGGGDRAG